ncbi:hypothetical protein [Actinomadura sp. 9N407]|uniref:hypothetical protein n=1 Tax=Actinomadura sp. 9N407 TaxID=3375154 RepID=UPI00379EA667
MTTTTGRPATGRPPGKAPARKRTGSAAAPAKPAATGTRGAPVKPAKPAPPAAPAKKTKAAGPAKSTAPAKSTKATSATKATSSAKTAKAVKSAPSRAAQPSGRRSGRVAAPPRTPFVLLICGLMGGALVSLLLLNTVLAEDAFTMSRLQQDNKLLGQQEQALQEHIAREESPESLADKAEALDMQRPVRLAYVDPNTSRVVDGSGRPIPHSTAAAAAAAGVLGFPGAIVPLEGVTAPATGTP